MIGDPERNVIQAVFYYPVAHKIRSIHYTLKITGKRIKLLLKLMFCKNEVTNGINPLYCESSCHWYSWSITARIVENQGFIWEMSAMKYFLILILVFGVTSATAQLRSKVDTSKSERVAV